MNLIKNYQWSTKLTKMAWTYEDRFSDKSNLTDDSKFISAVLKAFPMLVCLYVHIDQINNLLHIKYNTSKNPAVNSDIIVASVHSL